MPNAWHNSSNSGLGPGSQNIMEKRVAKAGLSWIDHVETQYRAPVFVQLRLYI
jgi:hypothetical protein